MAGKSTNRLDLTGQRFGHLFVLWPMSKTIGLKTVAAWQCLCDCGVSTIVQANALGSGNTQSCGCGKYKGCRLLDITDQKFGMLTAVRRVGSKVGIDQTKRATWIFRCDCGIEVQRVGIYVRSSLKYSVPNCGCRTLESKRANGRNNRTHGLTTNSSPNTRKLYDVHRQMVRRCHDENCSDYPLYGARGIYVCDEWRSVKAFIDWAFKSGYKPNVTIERQDNNGPYSPDNCTWIPNEQQARNTRRLRMLTFQGRTMFVSDWARELHIVSQTIIGRLNHGWAVERALTEPPRKGRNQYAN